MNKKMYREKNVNNSMTFLSLTAAFIIAILVCVLLFGEKNIKSMTASAALYGKPTVVLDAGHGGFDGGTVSLYGNPEKDINLSITLKTSSLLEFMGCEVILTRECDTALDKEKKQDMYNRLDIIKKYPDGIFLSIHQNHFTVPKYFGAQMFYGSKKQDESKALALILQKNFKENINNQNERQAKPAEKTLFLFKNAPQPCVLVECGFLSNPDEAKKLVNDEYQKQIAFTLVQSICEYYSLPE